jgi:hypothetical protein
MAYSKLPNTGKILILKRLWKNRWIKSQAVPKRIAEKFFTPKPLKKGEHPPFRFSNKTRDGKILEKYDYYKPPIMEFRFDVSNTLMHELLTQRKTLQRNFQSFNRQIYRTPNQEIRIMDWVFPLNSECLTSDTCPEEFLYRPMADILDHKEISDVKYEPLYDHYVIKLQDRRVAPFPLADSINSSRYFIEWLNSLGHTSARALALFMEKFTEKLFTNNVREVARLTSQKTYLKQLSEETLGFIRSRAYMINVHQVDKVRNRDQIVQLVASQKAVDYWWGDRVEKGITDHKFWRKFWGWGIHQWISLTLAKFSGEGDISFPPQSGIENANSLTSLVYPLNTAEEQVEI